MKKAMTKLNQRHAGVFRCIKNERGQGLVEYALIIVLVAVAAIAAMSYLGGRINNVYCNAGEKLTTSP